MWQQKRKKQAAEERCVYTLLGRARRFPSMYQVSGAQRGHIERAAINTPVQVWLESYATIFNNLMVVKSCSIILCFGLALN